VFSHCWGYAHSAIPYGKVAISLMSAETGAFEVVLSNDPAVFETDSLRTFDAVVFNNTNNELFLPEKPEELSDEGRQEAIAVDARLKKNLVDYVASGKGLAVLHAGVASFRKWPEFGNLMGARFENHPWGSGSTVTLKVEEPEHPLMRAFRGLEHPTITDEIYQLADPFSREDSRVLLSVDLERTEVTPQQEAAFRREDRDFPMCYVKKYGRGRVFYSAFGHDHPLFWNPTVLQHWLDGIQFVLGDLDGDITPSAVAARERQPELSWNHLADRIGLRNHGRTVWQLNFDHEVERVYFHPVGLLDGTPLTWLSPSDHVWHYALWFSWKHVNGVNYWEYLPDRGIVELVETTEQLSHEEFSAKVDLVFNYHPQGGENVMREERRLEMEPPDENGCYRITWRSTCTALDQDLVLDRTPPPGDPNGVGHGGYAGMSVRIAKETRDWRITDSEGRSGMECHRAPARWIHGDFARTDTGREGGIAILDHPENPRHPAPSFIVLDPSRPFVYYSPALLFNEPYRLKAGESVSLAYRIVVHPGRAEREWLDREWSAFSETPHLATDDE